jgi:hypothetical protein
MQLAWQRFKVGAFQRNKKMSFSQKPKKAPQLECFFLKFVAVFFKVK